jgi:hypothetical protein
MPTYNQAAYLERAIGTVLSQSFTDFELLVVDDGSTDQTPSILAGLRDSRVRVLRQANRGLPRALNVGFRNARGAYLTWVSSDNYAAPTFLEELLAALEAFPDALFAYSAFFWMDAEDCVTSASAWQDATYPSMLCMNPAIAAFMYRRECHDLAGWYDTGLEGAEDWDMWIRIRERAAPVYVTTPLCYYRLHADSLTGRGMDRVRRASVLTFRRAVDRLAGSPEPALARLYPDIAGCDGLAEASFDANLDFGLRVLASPYGAPDVARTFLRAARELSPDGPDAAVALAGAELACGNPRGARDLLASVDHAEPAIGEAATHLDRAAASGQPVELPLCPVARRFRPRSRLFNLVDLRRRARSFSLTGDDAFGDRAPRFPAASVPSTRTLASAESPVRQDSDAAGETGRQALDGIAIARLRWLGQRTPRMCIWGAGAAGLLAHRLLARLGIATTLFIDSDPAKHGTTKGGVPVVSPACLAAPGFAPGVACVVVASVGRDTIAAALAAAERREGVDYVVVPQSVLASEGGQGEAAAAAC